MGIGDNSPQKGYCLYVHQNIENLKLYIGITNNVKARWAKKAESYARCPKIYAAFKKYGWDNFNHIVLFDGLTKEEACEKERSWVKAAKLAGISYNLADGGEGTTGVIYSEERKKQISKQLTGRVCSSETRKKISESHKKLHNLDKKIYAFDKITKKFVKEYPSIRKAEEDTGVQHTRISANALGKVPSAGKYIWSYSPILDKHNVLYNRIRNNTLYCYDLQGNFIRTYKNAAEAAQNVSGFSSTILDVCKGRRLTYKGFFWRKEKEEIAIDLIKRANRRNRNEIN